MFGQTSDCADVVPLLLLLTFCARRKKMSKQSERVRACDSKNYSVLVMGMWYWHVVLTRAHWLLLRAAATAEGYVCLTQPLCVTTSCTCRRFPNLPPAQQLTVHYCTYSGTDFVVVLTPMYRGRCIVFSSFPSVLEAIPCYFIFNFLFAGARCL